MLAYKSQNEKGTRSPLVILITRLILEIQNVLQRFLLIHPIEEPKPVKKYGNDVKGMREWDGKLVA
jgi:hypothetical protein